MFDFGHALALLKEGRMVARVGWNGKGMFIFLVPGSRFLVTHDKPMGRALPHMIGEPMSYQPHIDMFMAQGSVAPWLASQPDMLAEDWQEVTRLEKTPDLPQESPSMPRYW